VSRVTASPGRKFAYLFAVMVVGLAGSVAFAAAPSAEAAAKPCWKRLIDDWVDNGRFDNKYSAGCIEQARRHLPEDIRAYSDIEEKINGLLLQSSRRPQNAKPTGDQPAPPQTRDGDGEPTPQPTTEPRSAGPISDVLNQDTTNSDSIPLPLILLAGLALLLMAAGASGIASRKLKARRASVRRPS
jgi:hypothetical protein